MTSHGLGGGTSAQDDPPDEETGNFGDASDPGLTADEDLDGQGDAEGGPPLHHG